MKIAIDAHGGDNAPLEIIKGCRLAVDELGANIVLVGKKDEIQKVMADNNISSSGIEIYEANDILTMEDDPTAVIKTKKESSMAVAFRLVKEGVCDAVVSAGNTGAVLVGATMIVKRIHGVKRAALAAVIPSETGPILLADVGANVVCKPEYIEQFAVMGTEYMKYLHGIENPAVALLNNGTESHKGQDLQQEAFKLLQESDINFIGNTEGRQLAMGGCDVIVTDGFSGNIALKTYEGVGKMMANGVKGIFKSGVLSKVGALFVLKKINAFKKKYDYKEYGGAPLLGISKPVIKAHGSSDARAFKNAIRQAILFQDSGMIKVIEQKLADAEK